MADTHNVFISWSGERSRRAAEALKEWLGNVLQNARPWMSTDMEKGIRSLDEIARALESMDVGIICLTPENLTAEWLLFEAGALSKTRSSKTHVCTYLLAGLEPANLKAPLSMFQATKANKNQTRDLIHTINKHLDATPVPDGRLESTFEKWWPDLEKILTTLPPPSEAPPPYPDTQEMVAELLELTRAMAPVMKTILREAERASAVRLMAERAREVRLMEDAGHKQVSYQDAGGTVVLSDLTTAEGALAGLAGLNYVPGSLRERPKPPSADTPTEPSKPAAPPNRPRGTDKK
jgi:hypothetical protein